MMILGYTLSAQDNGAYFFNEAPKHVLCPNCGTCLDYSWHPRLLRFTERWTAKDASYTYDCRFIVSEKFRNFCLGEKYPGLQLHRIYETPVLYYLLPERELPFDSDRRETRFIRKCEICGGYESIVGATPAFLRRTAAIEDGIFRSDLVFASGKEKHPLIIVGAETYRKMKAAKLTGLEFKKIES